MDADFDGLTISSVTGAAHGTATVTGGGSRITYVRNAGDTGLDTLTYTVIDGNGGSTTGSIRVFAGQNAFYQPTLRNVTSGFTATVGGASFNVNASGVTTAIGSMPISVNYSYEVAITSTANYPFFGVGTQPWYNAGADFHVATAAAGYWAPGVEPWGGQYSGTTSEFFTSPGEVAAGDVVGVSYSASTRKARIYRNGTLAAIMTLPISIGEDQVYPVVGIWVGSLAGSFRSTPSTYQSSYVFD
jgi:hypothetical protein